MALISPSPFTFVSVLTYWMEEGQHPDWGDESVCLCAAYYDVCQLLDTKTNGGDFGRFREQSENLWPSIKYREQPHKIKEEIDIVKENIRRLEEGEKIETTGKHKSLPIGVGKVSQLSFACLALFTELASPTDKAIQAAQHPDANPDSNYYESMPRECGCSEKVQQKLTESPSLYKDLFRYIATLNGWLPSSVENVFCAICRKHKRCDLYFWQQDLYNIIGGEMKIKTFDHREYQSFQEVRRLQREAYSSNTEEYPFSNS